MKLAISKIDTIRIVISELYMIDNKHLKINR